MFESLLYCSAKARSPLADFQAGVTMTMQETDAKDGRYEREREIERAISVV